MTTMPEENGALKGVIAGFDTHADVHVVAALDELGTILGTSSFPTDDEGYRAAHTWLCGHGTLIAAGVEGTGTYGAGITRFLGAHGVLVHEVNRPDRSTRRLLGKSDVIDAEAAARAGCLGGPAGGRRQTAKDPVTSPSNQCRSGAAGGQPGGPLSIAIRTRHPGIARTR